LTIWHPPDCIVDDFAHWATTVISEEFVYNLEEKKKIPK